MKFYGLLSFLLLCVFSSYAQEATDSTTQFKKRVLESTEISILSSFYDQAGSHASVTGGIGNEDLSDAATDIVVSIPIKEDNVLTIDGTISAYSSASSSNLNPFSGASSRGDDDDDDDDDPDGGKTTGTPWLQSSGASKSDVWLSTSVGYSHSSDDRNTIIGGNLSVANEYDYGSLGGGINFAKLWNDKNSELDIKFNTYFDNWKPQYPTEIHTFVKTNGNLNQDFFEGQDIYNQSGNVIDKNGPNAWRPVNTTLITDKKRNTYSASLGFSQVINQKAQFSIFTDFVMQQGWLANPMQRVYFSDKANYYVGDARYISNYTSAENIGVFQLADDIERLPDSRMKIPIGGRLNYYINEYLVFRGYYRYYSDDWDLQSNTINVELPIKVSTKFTLYPSYRFYNQTAAKYFAPYEAHLSTDPFYTSDYDLSEFSANQFAFGVKYTDLLAGSKKSSLGLKNVNLDFAHYSRDNDLTANIVSLGFNFVRKKK